MATKPRMPLDENNHPIPLAPARIALARSVSASLASSTQITFNAATRFIRCYAVAQDVYLKWGTTAATAANFDEIIPAGQIVDFVVPNNSTDNTTPYTGAMIIERVAGATLILIEK